MRSDDDSTTVDELRRVSARLGADRALAQAGGGNTSVKRGSTMWIKASGHRLADAERTAFIPVDLERYRAAVDSGVAPAVDCEASGRPSIETTMHAVVPWPFVLHLHATAVMAFAVRSDGKRMLDELLRGIPWTWVPYARPGIELARNVAEALSGSREARAMVLASHGLVVAGDDLATTVELLRTILDRCDRGRRELPLVGPSGVEPARALVRAASLLAQSLALDPVSSAFARRGGLYPDQAGFLGPDIHGCADPACRMPYEVLPGTGVFLASSASADILAMLECHADVLSRLSPDAQVVTLPDEEVRGLVTWEAEEYRRAMSR